MKEKLVFIVLVISMFSSNSIVFAENDIESQVLHNLFTYDNSDIKSLFSPEFLEQVPINTMIEYVDFYKNNLGNFKKVNKEKDNYTALFEKGFVKIKVALNSDSKIIGLYFTDYSLNDDNFENIISEFKKLEGSVSISIIKNNKEVVFGYNENTPMAVGSAFKLYVLNAVYDNVESGKISWDDIVLINNNNKSFPSGILQDWKDGTPVTLKTLTNLMISISDNTATDHLIDFLGRKNIEKYVSKINKPFLKTNEAFKIKDANVFSKQKEYINGNILQKRNLLKSLDSIDTNKVQLPSSPNLINEVEWFFTTNELCKKIYSLRNSDELRINPGLVAKENWYIAGYKGGSEPGVLNFTHLLQKNKDSNIYAISVTVNNTEKNLDTSKVVDLTKRLISLIEKESL
ncbi:beta-lactamase class A [Gottschalkia purinilytica]|uniref:Beta-lactamase class A n=1 Tax=Gottschalkia purinilytica TaxID=1503 RepID=A0A0L0WC24_GOTPU|nr:serine hydrolase [Gottschalkia purinilytica]KNF09017.1 beta-lactamase class A [Gottschalkia purinilytica]